MLNVIIKNKNLGFPAYLAFPKYSLQTRLKIFKKHKSKAAGLPAPKGRLGEESLCVCVN